MGWVGCGAAGEQEPGVASGALSQTHMLFHDNTTNAMSYGSVLLLVHIETHPFLVLLRRFWLGGE